MLILIMGLSGSGKTTLATKLISKLGNTKHLNADEIRKNTNNWDFSKAGRIKQVNILKDLALNALLNYEYVIADFICPYKKGRNILHPDVIIWMNTIKESKYKDTDTIFENPESDEYHFRISTFSFDYWANFIAKELINNVSMGKYNVAN